MIFVPEANVFTILGAGFGMYGYLPALMDLGSKVVLPLRYRSVLAGRPELAQYVQKVVWSSDVEDALAKSSAAIVALRPVDQAAWIPRLVEMSNLRRLILEKPVAQDPQLAASLLEMVEGAGKRYRIGYTFRFTPWARQLRMIIAQPAEAASMDWNFLAHHYRTGVVSWKRLNPAGGGAVRFYGIHAVALLAELGYDDVITSNIWGSWDAEIERWEATFVGRGLCPFALRINSRAQEQVFKIIAHDKQATRTIVDQPDPFFSIRSDVRQAFDSRVGVLECLCRSFDDADDVHAVRQKAILALWARVEQKSERH
jgi:hypothetical protein